MIDANFEHPVCKGKAFALTGRNCSNTRYPGCRFACPGLGAFGLSGRSRPNPKLESRLVERRQLPLKGAHISNPIAGQAPPTICAPLQGQKRESMSTGGR